MGYDRDAYQRNKADASYRMGVHSEVTGRTEDAVRKYLQAIEAFPAHYESHIQLSRIFKKGGMTERAAHHEEMARRSRLKIPLWEPRRDAPVDRRPAPAVPVSGAVDPAAGEVPDPSGDARTMKMLPLVWDAFYSRFDALREIQRKTAPVVLSGRNALIVSSTAGGKTEAVFAPLVQRLIAEGWQGLSIIYVSPTKALASDIRGRLDEMLGPLGIRAALRSGDIKELDHDDPQDVLVTTPESLDSLLSLRPEVVRDVRAIVLDELHMLDGTYRGDQLRVLLRRLSSASLNGVATYAASATVSDPDGLARRYMASPAVVSSSGGRGIDYHIVPSLERAAMIFRQRGLRKALVFCNTPEEAEKLCNGELRKYFPAPVLKVHHGKLLASKRMEAERALRSDERVVCVCTSTLEVGVDIGDIDMVILAHRPRSVASIAQRIGRGNRREERISTIAVARTAAESSYYDKVFRAIARSRYDSEVHSFDPSVAVQQTLAMLSGPQGMTTSAIVGTFDGLVPPEEMASILEHLERAGWIGRGEDGLTVVTARAREQGSKLYSNIPGSESIAVVEQETGMPIGNISLPIDNIFILGGQAWLVRKRSAERVMVSEVDSGTEIANFASYDRFGSFFDLLPVELRMRYKKALGKEREVRCGDLYGPSGAAGIAST